ncbi:hypothetical protein niasHT_035129 [Heterodera trifolii]|uniref:Nematode cuticle collagen N-terminal domain-containing protein n=1 Tax=Heterodera trifolii TaxID=157864 RepID=A0ABD2I7R8_9BILA
MFADFCLYDSELSQQLKPKNEAVLRQELTSMRRLAFFYVSISFSVTLLVAFFVPFLYNQIQYVQSMAQDEMEFCRLRARTIWREIGRTENKLAGQKQKRQTNGGEKCCKCGVGEEGIAGLPGADGKDGQDGPPGLDSIPFDFPVPSQLQPQVHQTPLAKTLGMSKRKRTCCSLSGVSFVKRRSRDQLDRPEKRDRTEEMGWMEFQAWTDRRENEGLAGRRGPEGCQECLERREGPVFLECYKKWQAHKAHQGNQDHPDCQVPSDLPENAGVREKTDSREKWAIPDSREGGEPMESRALAGRADTRADAGAATTAQCRELLPGIECLEKTEKQMMKERRKEWRETKSKQTDGRTDGAKGGGEVGGQ